MTTTRQDKPGAKPRQRSRKAGQRSQKGAQPISPAPDQWDQDQARPMVASSDAASSVTVSNGTAAKVATSVAMAPPDVPPVVAAAPVEVPPVVTAAPVEVPLVGEILPPVPAVTRMAGPSDAVSLFTIANAHADYARTSLQETSSFVEKFIAVRSFEKAIELQSEFASKAYANFIAESQKICELYGRLARQIFRPWASLRPN
jgi:Phasin protein